MPGPTGRPPFVGRRQELGILLRHLDAARTGAGSVVLLAGEPGIGKTRTAQELAAALVLGAQGANIGTRFLASVEASCGDPWKQAIVDAQSEDAVRVDVWYDIFPQPGPTIYDTAPRALRTTFIDHWQSRREEAHH